MKQPSEKLRQKIKKKRPDITESSINVYITSLRMLYSQYVDGNETKLQQQLKTKFLHDFDGVKKLLETCRTPNTTKTRLTAVLVALDAETKNRDQKLIDRYQAYLKDVMIGVNQGIESQEKTRKESKNWVTMDEVKDTVNKILTKINEKNLWKKENLSKSNFLLIQKYILLRFYIQYPWRNYVANTKVVTPSEMLSCASTSITFLNRLSFARTCRQFPKPSNTSSKPSKSLQNLIKPSNIVPNCLNTSQDLAALRTSHQYFR